MRKGTVPAVGTTEGGGHGPGRAVAPRGVDVLLADGQIATIRPVQPADRDALLALHEEACDDSIRMRFFSSSRTAAQRYVDHVVAGRTDEVTALVAHRTGRLVGIVTAEHTGPDSAEVAVLVGDAEHSHGVGTLLLEHVAAACRAQGIHRLVAEVLAENTAMLRVLADVGFTRSRRLEHEVVVVEMTTEATERALAAADAREAAAEALSLAPLLRPRNVVLVGVRRHGGGVGEAVLRAVRDGGFAGPVYVVHPGVAQIDGVPAYPSAREVPDSLDLAVVMVPASSLLATVEDLVAAHVRAAVVITSGLAELGADGASLQRRLVETARAGGLRLVGPNCMGLMSNAGPVRLNATFTAHAPAPGGLAVASQSGGVGIALLDEARASGLGVHSFVSLGNKADVSGNDLLAAWLDDPEVTAAGLYLESFGNPAKFARLARRFSARKPLLAVVGGTSRSGRRAGASHTAAAASPAVGVEALLGQAGVIRCESAEDMTRTARLLAEQPLPAGRRVAVVSNAGGLGVLAVDAAERAGLAVPEFSPALRARLAGAVSITVGTSNPVDLGAGASAANLEPVVAELLDSTEVDALVVVVVATTVAPAAPLVEAVERLRAAHGAKPVLLVALGGLAEEARGPATVLRRVDDAIEALEHTVRYAEWRRTPPAEQPEHDLDRADAAREIGRRLAVHAGPDGAWLAAPDAQALLEPYGLATPGSVVAGEDAAVQAAARLGLPAVLKAADPAVVHKTDRHLVHVGLMTEADVRRAARAVEAELGAGSPLLLQPLLTGVEIALGVIREPGFGPLVMVAAGGVTTSILEDRAFLMPPFTRQDAARAIRSLRAWPLLDGYRGAPRTDVAALEERVVALGALALDVPELVELDLNPVLCGPDGVTAVDAKVRLVPAGGGGPVDPAAPRALRAPA